VWLQAVSELQRQDRENRGVQPHVLLVWNTYLLEMHEKFPNHGRNTRPFEGQAWGYLRGPALIEMGMLGIRAEQERLNGELAASSG
jgi:hypothetical protein